MFTHSFLLVYQDNTGAIPIRARYLLAAGVFFNSIIKLHKMQVKFNEGITYRGAADISYLPELIPSIFTGI